MEMVIRTTWWIACFVVAGLQSMVFAHGESGEGTVSLDVSANGNHIEKLTGEKSGTTSALLFCRSPDGGENWSSPVRADLNMPAPFSLHRGMDAQIAGSGNHIIAVWTTAGTDSWGTGPMATSCSDDGGKTWYAGPNPADDSSTKGHGFIDIVADGKGVFHLTWLDGRDGKQGLRYARSNDFGKTWSKNVTIKSATCECCSNSIAAGNDGRVAIVYRDHDPRDMFVSHSFDGGMVWGKPERIFAHDWRFDGCPHVGGAIAFHPTDSSKWYAAIWSGKSNEQGVRFVSSGSQNPEINWMAKSDSNHPDIAVGRDSVAVVWETNAGEGTQIIGKISRDNGQSWSDPGSLSKLGSSASHPRVMAIGDGFRVFWTEKNGTSHAQLASGVLK